MSPEEYQRIKEAEKAHLRKLKELKQAVHQLERQKRVNRALDEMAGGPDEGLDTYQEMLDKLAMETAQGEARLEMALENQALDEETAPEAPLEDLEEDLLKARAQTLLQQIKMQMGVVDEGDSAGKTASREAAPRPASTAQAPREDAANPPAAEPPPEKTIGRMNQS